jgi:excinuclease ABC subunit A
MRKSSERPAIRLRGVRQNNLKNFDLDLPLNQLVVITGLSGSGKSSLAFDTLFAEGQRRYIETFSPYARQFFDRMDKPQADSIQGIPPAIAVEQRNAVKTTRSTVGTMTEICDYLKLLWPHVAQLHCRQCGRVVRQDAPQQIWETCASNANGPEVLITFDLPLSEKLSLAESLALVSRQGYQRVLIDGKVARLDEVTATTAERQQHDRDAPQSERRRDACATVQGCLTVVQDRVRAQPGERARFIEACEQAYHFGKGKLSIRELASPSAWSEPRRFSNRLHCAECDLEYREASPALFSFNHPLGACPACRGFGRVISIDYDLALPDRSKTLQEGVVKPWLTGLGAECQDDLMRACRRLGAPTDVPFDKLSRQWQDLVIEGEPGYGKDDEHRWPRAWYGVKGYFRWLESKAYKMHVRVLLSRYRAYSPCPDCRGQRFQPEALLYQCGSLTLAGFYQMPVREALRWIDDLARQHDWKPSHPLALVLNEIRSRLGYLDQVGLGYLTLDRPTRSLSGGETERVNLTTCLGARLVNTLFVLDEPSVGLHARDTERLVGILQQLRDAGNTVLVVEHEPGIMRVADQIVDLGPGHGATGGQVVFQGSYAQILKAGGSLTGQYLSGRQQITPPPRRPVNRKTPALELAHAALHNLKDLSVRIPLGRFVCLTGVSGSGKSTLLRDALLPALEAKFKTAGPNLKASDRLASGDDGEDESDDEQPTGPPASAVVTGADHLERVVLVDQSILGKTPRSNPAVYVGAFEDIREVFAQSELAKQRGLGPSAFSFNSPQGQCERCRGAGFEKIEMQFLSDVFIRCPDCQGRRYRPHILEVRIGDRSIADLLDATVEEAAAFLRQFPDSRPAQRAAGSLKLLGEAGLGYLKLGQPINTLSGGESQRLKLTRHLADIVTQSNGGRALFLFDEPTTGLHFDDVRVLLKVLQRLVDAGHSVVVIEHHLDVIKSADWVIDLGPEAGDQGGEIVAEGTPEQIAACAQSHTGKALRPLLKSAAKALSMNLVPGRRGSRRAGLQFRGNAAARREARPPGFRDSRHEKLSGNSLSGTLAKP